MRYASPELVVVGRAELLVLGGIVGVGDNFTSLTSQPDAGIALGLDD